MGNCWGPRRREGSRPPSPVLGKTEEFRYFLAEVPVVIDGLERGDFAADEEIDAQEAKQEDKGDRDDEVFMEFIEHCWVWV